MKRLFCSLITVCALATPLFAGPPPTAPASPTPASQQAMADALAKATHPTKPTLDATIARFTDHYRLDASWHASGRLDAPAPVTVQGVRGTCYTFVMRLDTAATLSAGLVFHLEEPGAPAGYAGPGVVGNGAVVTTGCLNASGPVAIHVTTAAGGRVVGSGTYKVDLYTKVLTTGQLAQKQSDEHAEQDRQGREIAERKASERKQATAGCATCRARFDGCLGAGRSHATCSTEYSSCAFSEAGADYPAICPTP